MLRLCGVGRTSGAVMVGWGGGGECEIGRRRRFQWCVVVMGKF